jgi:hypothetical protein
MVEVDDRPVDHPHPSRSKDLVLSLSALYQNDMKMTMKALLCVSLLLLGVLIGGCTTVSQERKNTSTTAVAAPNLLGNWTGTNDGYIEGEGYSAYSGDTMTMRVTEQKGRIFSGDFVFTNQSGVWKTTTGAGEIGRDGKTLTLVQTGGGYSSGTLVAPDEIEFIYTNRNDPFAISIDSLKKV